MQLFAPDILLEMKGLSVGLSIAGLLVGLLLWLTGWWGHRFWIVLGTTSAAGILGLAAGPYYSMKPLVAGLLLAIAAGVLALAIVRMIVFAAGGTAAYFVVYSTTSANWDEPLVWFLVGGLVGLLLFRLWTMTLTSFAGGLIMGYSLLCLLDRLGKLDAKEVAEQRATLLNALCLSVTVVGLIVQFILDRRRARQKRWKEEHLRHLSEREFARLYGNKRRWLSWKQDYRRAG